MNLSTPSMQFLFTTSFITIIAANATRAVYQRREQVRLSSKIRDKRHAHRFHNHNPHLQIHYQHKPKSFSKSRHNQLNH
ncbi:hypothetical protein GLOIN_2v1762118 [Rhizophagus clarus]|uniref:Uncharacterized protein n=1 Tax=Rhizophagus clarus TaxID=94130 RepID=A0A8H3L7E3_9GLOM|nr:hypothetical protein GLOIN_2v1762118 [Rhizophagus clarus]